MVSSYCDTYGFNGQIFRLANIKESRSQHGVIWDFIKKLKTNSVGLQILGDGSQSKSYLHISDCVECSFFCLSKPGRGWKSSMSETHQIDVLSIDEIVCNIMNLTDVELSATGGIGRKRLAQ